MSDESEKAAAPESLIPGMRFEKIATVVLLFCSAAGFAFCFSRELDNIWFFIWLPLWGVSFAFNRSAIFALLIPATVLTSLVGLKYIGSASLVGPQRTLLAISGIGTIVLATRYRQLRAPAANLLASQRMNYTPVKQTMAAKSLDRESNSKPFDFGLFSTLAFLVVGWLVAGYMSSQLAQVLMNYEQSRIFLDNPKNIGLLPEYYVGLIVLFIFAALLWFARQVFSYLVLRQRDGSVAAMHLRIELWKWDGSDQRRIAKELSRLESEAEARNVLP